MTRSPASRAMLSAAALLAAVIGGAVLAIPGSGDDGALVSVTGPGETAVPLEITPTAGAARPVGKPSSAMMSGPINSSQPGVNSSPARGPRTSPVGLFEAGSTGCFGETHRDLDAAQTDTTACETIHDDNPLTPNPSSSRTSGRSRSDDGLCFGDTEPDIDAARANYTTNCGITYSDTSGLHRCDWATAGWTCQGPRTDAQGENPSRSNSPTATPAPSRSNNPTSTPAPSRTGDRSPAADGICFGDTDPDIDTAKANYTTNCGTIYSDTSGLHRCDWATAGWTCQGPRTDTQGENPSSSSAARSALTSTPRSTVTPTPTPTPDPTATPSPSRANDRTATSTPRPTPDPGPAPNPSPTNDPTETPTPTPTNVPTETPTPTPTNDPTVTPNPSPTTDRSQAADAICFGDTDPNIDTAKANYTTNCGITYSDTSGLHRCDWATAGWTCQGPRNNPNDPNPTPTNDPSRTNNTSQATDAICFGDTDPNIDTAKANYTTNCGITYSDTSGLHRCEWATAGWTCQGPRSDG